MINKLLYRLERRLNLQIYPALAPEMCKWILELPKLNEFSNGSN